MKKMYRFTFESVFESKKELRKEIAQLLWQIDHTWPLQMSTSQIDWIKEKVDEAWLKVNHGARRQSIEVTPERSSKENLS